MKQSRAPKTKTSSDGARGSEPIAAYAQAQPLALRTICDRLRELIEAAIPNATSKVWHGSPVWFIDDNPVVGYSASAKSVNLLFWNGQALDEADFQPVGKFGAAQAVFAAGDELDATVVRRWLEKAASNVFDSRAFFKKMRDERKSRR